MLPEDDVIRLRHMLEAAETAVSFSAGRTRQELDSDRMLSLAIVRAVEIIGEAAGRVTLATRNATPQIPWASITAMRNRLIHAYFDIDLDRVWDTVTDDLPPLVGQLENLLKQATSA